MSTREDWIEEGRIERARLERRADPQTGFLEDAFWNAPDEDEELEDEE